MSNGFHYSETSAFTPVPYDIYDYTIQNSNMNNEALETEVIMPLCEFETRPATQQPFVDQWVAASLHQPSYESGLPFSILAYPYMHECLGEPGFIRKRNERERMRVRNVNEGYAVLRDHLPIAPSEKRLSKVETLRGAIRYIKMLERVLKESEVKSEDQKSKLAESTDVNNNDIKTDSLVNCTETKINDDNKRLNNANNHSNNNNDNNNCGKSNNNNRDTNNNNIKITNNIKDKKGSNHTKKNCDVTIDNHCNNRTQDKYKHNDNINKIVFYNNEKKNSERKMGKNFDNNNNDNNNNNMESFERDNIFIKVGEPFQLLSRDVKYLDRFLREGIMDSMKSPTYVSDFENAQFELSALHN